MAQTTITKNQKELELLVRKNVISVLREVFTDPEYSLPLKPSFIKKLQRSIQSKQEGKIIDFDEILRKYKV